MAKKLSGDIPSSIVSTTSLRGLPYELSSVLTFEVTRSEFCHLQQRAPVEAIQPCQTRSHNGLTHTMLAFSSKAINVSPPSVNLFLEMERIVKLESCSAIAP